MTLETIHPALVTIAQPVGQSRIHTSEIQDLIQQLVHIREVQAGGGIAAPQIGISLRIFVAEYDAQTRKRYPHKKHLPRTIAIDPRLEFIGDDVEEIWEGCLSQPNLRGPVNRHMHVKLHAFDENGHAFTQTYFGLAAGTIQHEYDHLDGILFPQRVSDRNRLVSNDYYQKHVQQLFEQKAAKINQRYQNHA